jgi:KipI family sensor histidine kinase inhibitor
MRRADVRLLPCGDTGLLVEVGSLDAVLVLADALVRSPPPGVVDVVPAARTVLLRFDPSTTTAAELERAVHAVRPVGVRPATAAPVELEVVYDGPDLEEVGRLTGLGPRGVVEAHTGQVWTVAFPGFAPGFAYLVGADERLHVPRRPEPRVRVPAGAVGLAGEFSGVYPRASPGGWQLVGSTAAVLWDVERDPPALLRPGTSVRFRERRP